MTKKGGALTEVAVRARLSLDRRPLAHFLHIRKAAGTALLAALKDAEGSARYRVVGHKHADRLVDLPESDYFFFCVRDPIGRYVSGFLSRQREGRPRYHIPWTEGEAEAFGRFDSPDALAVSLSEGGAGQRDAEAAMEAIPHLRSSYWDWFQDPDYFKSRADHILWIGRQESLDVKPLAATLGLERLEMPTDPERANRRTGPTPELSELARRNLREWYAKEYSFLEICDELCPADASRRIDSSEDDGSFVHRVMTRRPFATRNEDALRYARIARRRPPSRLRSLAHSTLRRPG